MYSALRTRSCIEVKAWSSNVGNSDSGSSNLHARVHVSVCSIPKACKACCTCAHSAHTSPAHASSVHRAQAYKPNM